MKIPGNSNWNNAGSVRHKSKSILHGNVLETPMQMILILYDMGRDS